MKNSLLVIMAFFILFGCTNLSGNPKSVENGFGGKNATTAVSEKNTRSLEGNIKSILSHKGLPESNDIDIVDYEIKNNYMFVVTYHKLKGFSVTILKNDHNELKWNSTTNSIDDPVLIGPTNAGPYLFIIPSNEKDVKDVTVLGQPAKMIKITKSYSKDYKQEVRCWIYVTDSIGKPIKDYSPDKDIKYIK